MTSPMTFAVLLVLGALLLAGIRRAYRTAHPTIRCAGCGLRLGRARRVAGGARCASCQYKAERDARAARQYEAAHRDAERAYAAAEAARIAGRFRLRRAGTFGRVAGEFVLDGWVFEDPHAVTDTAEQSATGSARLTLSRWACVYGWSLDELHAEAHGAFCTCL